MGKGRGDIPPIVLFAALFNLIQLGMVGYTIYLGFYTADKTYSCSFNSIALNYGTVTTKSQSAFNPGATKCGPVPNNNVKYKSGGSATAKIYTCEMNTKCYKMMQYCKSGSSNVYKVAYDGKGSGSGTANSIQDPNCVDQVDLESYSGVKGTQTCDRDFTSIIRAVCGMWASSIGLLCCGVFMLVGVAGGDPEKAGAPFLLCLLCSVCLSLATFISIIITLVWKGDSNCETYSPDFYKDLNTWTTWVVVLIVLGCMLQASSQKANN